MNEYARLWDLFEQTFERMNVNEPIPSRLDGRPRLRSNIREPIGLTNSQNYCWLTSYFQLLVCMDDPIQTVRSNDNERVRKLKQEMIKTLLEMKASQKAFFTRRVHREHRQVLRSRTAFSTSDWKLPHRERGVIAILQLFSIEHHEM